MQMQRQNTCSHFCPRGEGNLVSEALLYRKPLQQNMTCDLQSYVGHSLIQDVTIYPVAEMSGLRNSRVASCLLCLKPPQKISLGHLQERHPLLGSHAHRKECRIFQHPEVCQDQR